MWISTLKLYILYTYTVKPVLRGHFWDKEKVADRTGDLLIEVKFIWNLLRQDKKKLTYKYRWLLNRGDLLSRFDCRYRRSVLIIHFTYILVYPFSIICDINVIFQSVMLTYFYFCLFVLDSKIILLFNCCSLSFFFNMPHK